MQGAEMRRLRLTKLLALGLIVVVVAAAALAHADGKYTHPQVSFRRYARVQLSAYPSSFAFFFASAYTIYSREN